MTIVSDALSSILGSSGDLWDWQEHLHPASFRGVPFAVVSGEGVYGRRNAIHEYPYRDTAWIEDLGRATRRFTIRGFIIQSSRVYDAPDVMMQRDSLIAACESGGTGTLVHPTLGELTVSITESGLRINESVAGRVFEFTLTAIESGLLVFAVTGNSDALSSLKTSWFGLTATSTAAFIGRIKSEIRAVTHLMRTLQSTAGFWVNLVASTTTEATNLSNTLRDVFGNARYGRYSRGDVGGSSSGAIHSVTNVVDTTNYHAVVAQQMAVSVTSSARVSDATQSLLSATTPERYASGVIEVLTAVISGVPATELVRVATTLAGFTPQSWQNPDDQVITDATVDMMTTLAAGAVAYAASQYQPSSYDDAEQLLDQVCDVLDIALLRAGDTGDDATYQILSDMRYQTVATLRERGANLANITTVSIPASMPSLTLANRLYQDVSRSDGLVKMANPIHPAFMPLKFRALTK